MHQEPISPRLDAINELNEMNGDPETDHGNAEQCLLDYLRATGSADVADAFEKARDRVGFWYA